MHRIAVFASGTGSNAARIIAYFNGHEQVEVSLIVSNKADAKVLEHGPANNIPTRFIGREEFYKSEILLDELREQGIELLALAGFLWLIPQYLVEAYPKGILNIHPALLPNFGGKGMYGMNVHRAVVASGATESGMTIHWVDVNYDEGQIVFQARCEVLPTDTPEQVAARVLQLEHANFPRVIEEALLG